MKWTQEQVERVRNLSIADCLGVSVGRRTNVQCPMQDHSDSTASFLIDEDNGYYCFGCGVRGQGFIDFATDLVKHGGGEADDKIIFAQVMSEFSND